MEGRTFQLLGIDVLNFIHRNVFWNARTSACFGDTGLLETALGVLCGWVVHLAAHLQMGSAKARNKVSGAFIRGGAEEALASPWTLARVDAAVIRYYDR